MRLQDTLLAEQLFSDQAPPISIVFDTPTSLQFTWQARDERLTVEITLERRAHWHYRNGRTQEVWEVTHDADTGWPTEAKRRLMRFNRRAA
jgi:hypothetical protein